VNVFNGYPDILMDVGRSETQDAGGRLAVPNAADCGRLSQPRKTAHFPARIVPRRDPVGANPLETAATAGLPQGAAVVLLQSENKSQDTILPDTCGFPYFVCCLKGF
jgi:hypothetical protein